MKTDPRIRKILKPLLERNADLTLVGSTIWLRPIHHIGRHIVMMHDQDHCFRLEWRLPNLFVPFAHRVQHPNWFTESVLRSSLVRWTDYHPMRDKLTRRGEDEYMNWGRTFWNYDDPTMPEDFVFQIESLLRLLRSLSTLEKCVAFLHMRRANVADLFEDWSMFANLSLGHVGVARAHWISVRQDYLGNMVEHPRSPVELRNARFCELDGPLIARDRRALAMLLHRWEAENIATLKLHNLWESTPFPMELSA